MSNNEFITTFNASNNYGKYQFKTDGSDFDGIKAQAIPGYEPWNQLWEGFTEKEKSGMTLITKNTEIKKEIKDKKTGKLMPIQGVRFCQEVDYELSQGEEQYCSEPTNSKGITWLEVDKMAYGESYLVEKFDGKVYQIDPNTTQKTETEVKPVGDPVKIYVDLGTRFLGETSGEDLITYQDLVEQIENKSGTSIGIMGDERKKNQSFNKWLKIYDTRKNKVIYISKIPVTNAVSWQKLYKAGAIFGLENLDLATINKNTGKIKTNSDYNLYGQKNGYEGTIINIGNRYFIVRLLKTTTYNTPFIRDLTSRNGLKTEKVFGSEWNRYIVPLLKYDRDNSDSKNIQEGSLNKKNDEGYSIELAPYGYFRNNQHVNGDLDLNENRGTLSLSQEILEKEISENIYYQSVLLRGEYNKGMGQTSPDLYAGSIGKDDSQYAFRPVLEEIPQNCYDGACFEGEVAGTDFITYKELLEDIEGKSLETLPKDTTTNKPKTKVGDVLDLGNDEATGGNWLKIHDYKEGKTLYISKKPLTNYVSWQDLYKAGVVFGLDQVDKDTMKLKIQPQIPEYKKNSSDKTGKNLSDYKATKIEINGKPYIVRLLKGINTEYTNTPSAIVTQGSEWNRYILPLVKDYRYGKESSNDIEQALKDGGQQGKLGDSKKFKIQLTKYNWFEDLTLYEDAIDWVRCGQKSWVQEYIVHSEYERNIVNQFYRGSYVNYIGGAYLDAYDVNVADSRMGFRPVLEEITE